MSFLKIDNLMFNEAVSIKLFIIDDTYCYVICILLH